jgi:hypothetical protein
MTPTSRKGSATTILMSGPSKLHYTKGEVNRAGLLMLDLKERLEREGVVPVDPNYDRRLDEAWDALVWWRRLHARPLSTVAANLRYHVDKADGRVDGRIDVTQRLKRIPTLVGKLGRERGERHADALRSSARLRR